MSVSVKISQLLEGGTTQSQDQIPVARGTETYKIPASQFVIAGQNVGVGPGQIFSTKTTGAGSTLQFRTLSGSDGLSVSTQGQTLVITASGQSPSKTKFTGNGSTTTFALIEANSINVNNYRVDIDGVLQEPGDDYTINGSNIVFSSAPPLSSKVVVVSNNLVRTFDTVPVDGSVTSAKLATDIQYSIVPTGAIMPFYRSTAPDGWLICDGSAIPAQFTTLISLVGANTPNLRGMFIRGWSPSTTLTSRDPLSGSRTLGSTQEDAFERHQHGGVYAASGSTVGDQRNINYSSYDGFTDFTGDVETRPVNIALLYCIKT